MHTFASVAVVDRRGWVLLQEQDEHAPADPNRWCFPGGGLEEGETFRAAAARELAEETGLLVPEEDLLSLGRIRFHNTACGEDDDFELFLLRRDISDEDIVCGEGRQMLFVHPDRFQDLDLIEAARIAAPRVPAA